MKYFFVFLLSLRSPVFYGHQAPTTVVHMHSVLHHYVYQRLHMMVIILDCNKCMTDQGCILAWCILCCTDILLTS